MSHVHLAEPDAVAMLEGPNFAWHQRHAVYKRAINGSEVDNQVPISILSGHDNRVLAADIFHVFVPRV
jgi:hypothetical protein